MTAQHGSGNFINNTFLAAGNMLITSYDPSKNFKPVFSVKTDLAHVELAVGAARQALPSWQLISFDERKKYLLALKASFIKHEQTFAQAISQETGKIMSEALVEAKNLSARVDLTLEHGLKRVATEFFIQQRSETRYHSQGVLAAIGPYNFPAHLVNSHVIPALLTSNTVVIKPSELCPWVGEIYASCFLEAGFPAGVVNLIHGDKAISQALCVNSNIDGVLFTGSYTTGRALKELLLDQPHKLLALEMGGKNFAVVMDDADPKQAVLEIIQGAFLTAGQRCTATSRVLIHEKIYDRIASVLIKLASNLPVNFYGPLASKAALEKFLHTLARAREEGAHVLLEAQSHEHSALVTPAIYQVSSDHPTNGFLSEELFGPHICLEKFSTLSQAITRVNQSPFGLSNAIFTLDTSNSERFYHETKSGVLNINRSTNGAFGNMPFGGINKSGNQRPAGIDAVRYTSFPVAMSSLAYGAHSASKDLSLLAEALLQNEEQLRIISLRHQIEALFEIYNINSDQAAHDKIIYLKSSFDNLNNLKLDFFNQLEKINTNIITQTSSSIIFNLDNIQNSQEFLDKLQNLLSTYSQHCALSLRSPMPLAINTPADLYLPRSQNYLDRLYKNNFVPAEKKLLIADLNKSRGAYLASIDDDPLVLFDAASQIATLGSGFYADMYQNAYDTHEFDLSLLSNFDLAQDLPTNSEQELDALKARELFESFLHEKSHHQFSSISYGAGGAEANEIAFDLCRQHGPGGTRIIAFEGSFHGRTIMSLQATYNKEKRGPFAFLGYEALFLPFPAMNNPQVQPEIPKELMKILALGEIPELPSTDSLLNSELETLRLLKQEASQQKLCCVIIEPMQCEGGDRYASHRFFNFLRALTKALQIPLVFDEVQTGFNLGTTFFWHEQFKLDTPPDCMTLAKKAQSGVCMSVWANTRSSSPHIIQLKRGLLQAQALKAEKAFSCQHKAQKELERLQEYFPTLVTNSRASGFAFAFDMPSSQLANELINQRFERGFMVYIAGEKTLRFRLNMTSTDEIINLLFEKLFIALSELRDNYTTKKIYNNKNTKQEIPKIIINNLNLDNFSSYAAIIEQIENSTYEQGRRDSIETLQNWLKQKDSLGLVLKYISNNEEIIGGYAVGGPLEYATADGCAQDLLGQHADIFYSADITLDARVRGLGLGRQLKEEQIRQVCAMKKSDGTPRYQFMTGRNRVGHAAAMTRINENLGAYTVKIYDNQYGDSNAKAAYYRLPLNKTHALKQTKNNYNNCYNSIQEPFSQTPPRMISAAKSGQLRALSCSKLTLSNWATPNLVRYSELLRAVMPQHLRHAYFTSGRDEVVDKGLRSLRFHRPQADIALGFSHQWLGHISAAARSLSHDENQAQPFAFFDWPKISHPQVSSPEHSLDELEQAISRYSPERILGIIVELVGERSALTFDEAFLLKLDQLRQKYNIPLVFVETASSLGRSGKGVFLSDALSVKANMILWYSGGQLGHVFVDSNYFVEKPLTLISTWDGDDISILRAYHHLLYASEHSGLWQQNAWYFEAQLKKLSGHGVGFWHGIKLKNQEELNKIRMLAKSAQILLGAGFDNTLMICPKPDIERDELERIIQIITSSL
jgi:succinylglutamate-semialdehyde dehydrogenase